MPCCADAGGRLPLQTATMLDTIVMICVKFSFSVGAGIGVRTPESTLWIAYTMDSVWASRYGYLGIGKQKQKCQRRLPNAQNAERRTLSSDHASSDGAESSLMTPLPRTGDLSNIGGGEFVLELEGSEDDVPLRSTSLAAGDSPSPRLELAADDLRSCPDRSSSTERLDGGGCEVSGGTVNSSCSARVALRMQMILEISVTVAETWLAAASRRLTGDIPELKACVLVATTRFERVASRRSREERRWSTSTLARAGRISYARTSSMIAEVEFTIAFIGMRTRVGAFVRPAARRLSIPDTKAVT